mmetsp:Transcript_79715/g.154077  ORF Transcript_79715/g.154077 Transcript_79715/m.154077 type:complete len:217 (+) Transcript_79715:60-710(+)
MVGLQGLLMHSSEAFRPVRDEESPCMGDPAAQSPAGWLASNKIPFVGVAMVLGVVALAGFNGSMPLMRPHYSIRGADSSAMPVLGLAEESNSGGTTPGGKDIVIRVCRNEECDKYHPHGLVHEYSMDLNKCEKVTDDDNAKTNGKYQIFGAASNTTLSNGIVLTAEQCGEAGQNPVYHQPFELIIGAFTDCCSFFYGGCGFKCITFQQGAIPPVYQ